MDTASATSFVAALPGIWVGLLVLCLITFSVFALIRNRDNPILFWISVSPMIGVFIFLSAFLFSNVDFPTRASWEWILPKEESGALRLGFEVTPISSIIGISFLLGIFTWLTTTIVKKRKAPEGSIGGAVLATAAVLASWTSNTAAFSILGIALSLVSSMYYLQMTVEDENDSSRILMSVLPKLLGLFILILGLSGFAAAGLDLDFGSKASAWSGVDLSQNGIFWAKILLTLGLFLLIQPIPGAGALWISTAQHTTPFSMIALVPVPLSVLALLFRMDLHLKELEIMGPWIGSLIASGALVVFAQFFQKDIKGMVRNWIVISPILIAVVLGVSGKIAAQAVILGWLFFIPALTESIERAKSTTSTSFFIFALLGVMGFFGFYPAVGMIHAYATTLEEPLILAGIILLGLGSGTGLMRIVSLQLKKKNETQALDASFIFPVISSLLMMGWFLCGTWSGGFFHDQLDVIESLSKWEWVRDTKTLFSSQSEDVWVNAILVHAAVFFLSPLFGYLTRLADLSRSLPKVGAWVIKGFGADQVFESIMIAGERTSTWSRNRISNPVWEVIWPKMGEWTTRALRAAGSYSEKALTGATRFEVSKLIDVPAKLIQLIQSGDAHWYLFFCVLSAFIALMHFIEI